jgi:serine/threonine protein kinase/predicted Zn-dependent protease
MNKAPATTRLDLNPENWQILKGIVADALEQKSSAERTALVQSRCANDATLLAEAESLVREAAAFLKDPTDSLEDCADHATALLWQDETPMTGRRIGAYLIVRELGRGGMGAVFLARRADGQFEKEVAIKILKRGTDTDEVLRRFADERHILARLDHPNISRLLDAGTTDDGLPYLVMEYVAGRPITRFVREQNLTIAERLSIFLKVCAAVEIAHQNHVIHRDLKPSNILVKTDGEPKLLDFGIAKLLDSREDGREVTSAGQERLTPNCASPEQTDGRLITEASDVYALGALLYEILSGQKPHKFTNAHPSHDEIVRVIREEEPPRPSEVVSGTVSKNLRPLDPIVQKAMCKDPSERYAKIADLTSEVRRYLEDKPLLTARHSDLSTRHRLWSGRAIAVATVALVLLVSLFVWLRTHPAEVSSPPPSPKSIAVLPFDSLGSSDAPSYFVEGVQDNILTDLGKVKDLRVVSRSGVAAYRGKNVDAKEIGKELGVANVLQGSLQLSGDRVRINAQLIDTRSDTQIWAEHYDRKVEDIFSLQGELAEKIVAQLRAQLSSAEKAAIFKRPTEDLQAYDLYLRARSTFYQVRTDNQMNSWNAASELLQQAIARDSKFALAYAFLNEVYLHKYRFGMEHNKADLAAAKEAADKALSLQPDLEEARVALARYYYYGLSDYRRTLEQLSMLSALEEHDAEYYTIASLVERRLGRWAESVRDGEKAVELEPNNLWLASNLVQTYNGLRRYADATRVAESTTLRLAGRSADHLWLLRSESALDEGNLDLANTMLEMAAGKDFLEYQLALLWLDFLTRDFAAAHALMENATEATKGTESFWLTAGMIARTEGKPEAAREAFQQAKNIVEHSLQQRPDSPELLSELAEACSGLGQHADAIREAQRAVELAPANVDSIVAPYCAVRLAQVLAWSGDYDGALKTLAAWVPKPFGPDFGDLKIDPLWDDLRSDPRFDQLLAEAKIPPVIAPAR